MSGVSSSEQSDAGGPRLPRRGFFRLGFRRAAQIAADAVESAGHELGELQRHMADGQTVAAHGAQAFDLPPERVELQTRPPGALDEGRFLQACTRCGDCVQACPVWAIRSADPEEAQPGYPLLEPNLTACSLCEDPLPCISSCQEGALIATPRESVRLGLALVDAERCMVPHGQSCDFCVQYCPVPDFAIRMTAEGPVISESGCTGCGSCVGMCPETAIQVHAR